MLKVINYTYKAIIALLLIWKKVFVKLLILNSNQQSWNITLYLEAKRII